MIRSPIARTGTLKPARTRKLIPRPAIDPSISTVSSKAVGFFDSRTKNTRPTPLLVDDRDAAQRGNVFALMDGENTEEPTFTSRQCIHHDGIAAVVVDRHLAHSISLVGERAILS